MNILRKAKDDVESIVDTYLETTTKKIKDHKEHLSLKGKNIEVANVEQTAYLAFYDEMRVDLKSLLAYYELKLKESKAVAWKTINEHASVSHSDREKDILVNNNPSYMKVNRTYLHVKELYDTLDSIVEQFRSRAFTLNNIIKIRVASLEGISLYE